MGRIQAAKCASKRSAASASSKASSADKADLKPTSRPPKRAATGASQLHSDPSSNSNPNEYTSSASSLEEEEVEEDEEEEEEDDEQEEDAVVMVDSEDEESEEDLEGDVDSEEYEEFYRGLVEYEEDEEMEEVGTSNLKWKNPARVPWPKPSNSTVGRAAARTAISNMSTDPVSREAFVQAATVYQEVYHKARMERLRAQQIERAKMYAEQKDSSPAEAQAP